MREECLVCKAKLIYLEREEEMECVICHKKERSHTKCVEGHYVCNECHMKGLDDIFAVCMQNQSKDPIAVLEQMMALPSCHMHGPEHHIMVGAALLTAYHNAGGEIDLAAALGEMVSRGKKVPGGACGFWGACGAGISSGMFLSIITAANPLAGKEWGLSNRMTAASLEQIGKLGGPRCCKRNSYTAIKTAIDYVREHLGVAMDDPAVSCSRSEQNNQCIGKNCPYHSEGKKKVVFLCVHNSCRSQIAEALGKLLASDRYEFYSAGTEVKPQINPDAVRLMKVLYDIDMEKTQYSKTVDDIPNPDIIITMGCDVGCPYIGREPDADWGLPDPTGKSDSAFIDVIEQIADKIEALCL